VSGPFSCTCGGTRQCYLLNNVEEVWIPRSDTKALQITAWVPWLDVGVRQISYQSSRATAVLVPSAAVGWEPEAAARTGVSCGTLEATGTDVGCGMEAAAWARIVSERQQRKAALSAAQRRQREQAFAAALGLAEAPTEHGGQGAGAFTQSQEHRPKWAAAVVACTGRWMFSSWTGVSGGRVEGKEPVWITSARGGSSAPPWWVWALFQSAQKKSVALWSD